MDEMKCPACGEMLKLVPAKDAGSDAMPSMDDAATMPLDELRSKLPKKSEE